MTMSADEHMAETIREMHAEDAEKHEIVKNWMFNCLGRSTLYARMTRAFRSMEDDELYKFIHENMPEFYDEQVNDMPR